jgi:6-phosphofructokinase
LEFLSAKRQEGQRGLVITISEGSAAQGENPSVAFTVKGSPQAERYGGVSQQLARWIESEINWECRNVVLGHLQRSKQPTTTDRFLTFAMGVEVARMVKDEAWGQAVVYRNGRVGRAPVTDLMEPARLVTNDHRWVAMAQAIGILI